MSALREAERLRVLATGPEMPGAPGMGIQRHIRALEEGLCAGAGITVHQFNVASVVRPEPHLFTGLRILGSYFAFPFAVMRADLVHVNSSLDNRSILRDSGLVVLARLLRKPVVVQFHGGTLSRLKAIMRQPLCGYVSSSLRRASLIMFLSENQGRPVAEKFGLTRITYVRNFVDTSTPPAPKSAEPGLHVLFLGRLDELKGALETIAAFGLARQPGWELRVGGGGPLADEVATAARRTPGVQFLGFVDGALREELLAWAHVFVLPSDYDEGLPYAALEAAAAGVALVTSNRGALATLTRDGETGLLVPARDVAALSAALTSLGANRGELSRMGAAARALVEREFALSMMCEEYGSAYERARAQHARAK